MLFFNFKNKRHLSSKINGKCTDCVLWKTVYILKKRPKSGLVVTVINFFASVWGLTIYNVSWCFSLIFAWSSRDRINMLLSQGWINLIKNFRPKYFIREIELFLTFPGSLWTLMQSWNYIFATLPLLWDFHLADVYPPYPGNSWNDGFSHVEKTFN